MQLRAVLPLDARPHCRRRPAPGLSRAVGCWSYFVAVALARMPAYSSVSISALACWYSAGYLLASAALANRALFAANRLQVPHVNRRLPIRSVDPCPLARHSGHGCCWSVTLGSVLRFDQVNRITLVSRTTRTRARYAGFEERETPEMSTETRTHRPPSRTSLATYSLRMALDLPQNSPERNAAIESHFDRFLPLRHACSSPLRVV